MDAMYKSIGHRQMEIMVSYSLGVETIQNTKIYQKIDITGVQGNTV
jgi:predicted transposase YdaD